MNGLENNLLLYAVTDRTWLKGETLLEQIEAAILGGATMIQLREKNLAFEDFLDEAIQVKKLTAKYNIPLIINDNVEVAKRSSADGVHLGRSDMAPKEARKILGVDKIIGVSAKTVIHAKEAEAAGVDYIGVGAAFGTSTKSDATTIDHAILREICQSVSIPAVAIGGITAENIRALTGTQIAGVAVVSAIFGAEDIKSATKQLLDLTKQTVMRGAIFDLDGTLVDSMPYWENIAARYLTKIGVVPKPDVRESIRKMHLLESAEYIKDEYNLAQSPDQIVSDIVRMVSHYYRHEIQLIPGVKEFLQRLKGIKKCVCTLSDPTLTRAVLERNGILNEFDDIISGCDYNMGKDTHELYEIARRSIGTDKKYTYIFEDSDYAMETAKKGGFTVVGIGTAGIPKEKVRDLCDFYTEDYQNWDK